jgi:hypothetical protein
MNRNGRTTILGTRITIMIPIIQLVCFDGPFANLPDKAKYKIKTIIRMSKTQ